MLRTMLFGSTLAVGLLTTLASASEQVPSNSQAVQGYYYEVWGSSSKESKRDRPWSEPFDSEADARTRLRTIQRDYAKGGLLEADSDKPLRLYVKKTPRVTIPKRDLLDEAKKAADAAQEAAEKLEAAQNAIENLKKLEEFAETGRVKSDSSKERWPGDTLKEYGRRLKDSFDRVIDAKKTLTSGTNELAEKKFNEVNRLIDSYNREVGPFNGKASAAGLNMLPTISRLTPGELESKPAPESTTGKYTVWVYRSVNSQWRKQDDRTLNTDDEEQARAYEVQVKGYRGWIAKSNVPAERKSESPDNGQKDEPEIVGSWVLGGDTRWNFLPDGTWQMAGTGNRGRWRKTSGGIAVQYSGSTFWSNLKFVADTLVIQDGYIGPPGTHMKKVD